MSTSAGSGFIHEVAQRGIPAVWEQFGAHMSADGAMAAQVAQATREAYCQPSPEARQAVLRLFDEKSANLAAARELLADRLVAYRDSGRWDRLNAAVRVADVEALIEDLRPHFGLHPYPIVLESVRFNFEFVQQHGFEEFYRMTDQYLAEIERVTDQGRDTFEANEDHASFPPFWLYKLEMASVEVPTRCHIRENVITFAERAVDADA